jgi:ribosome-associated heat shock protein Hsp15
MRGATDPARRVRLDKWLWAARFFKSRSAAAAAAAGGHVEVNDARAKPGRMVGPGDHVTIIKGELRWLVTVRQAGERRGPAYQAAELYEEAEESRRERERLLTERRAGPVVEAGGMRPTKRDRRRIHRFTRRST